MRLTRFGFHGLVFYTALVGAFFASPYSNLFFLLLGFLTLLGLGGALWAQRNVDGVTAALGELEPVPAGAPVQLPLELSADGRARFGIEARLELAGGARLEGRVELLEQRAMLTLAAPALPRGCHRLTRAHLASTHPFGIVRARRTIEAAGELVVHPSPHESIDGRSTTQALDELLGPGAPGAGSVQPASLRDHREGDGVRGIHWRATARRGRLVVQEWDGGTGHGLEVLLDRRCTSDELEESLRAVSALVHLARTAMESLRIQSQGLAVTFGDGHAPWSEALRFLAGAELLPPDAPPPPPAAPGVARLPRAPGVGRARAAERVPSTRSPEVEPA